MAHAETEGALRLGVLSGYDSNVRRDYDVSVPVGDAMGSLVLSLDGRSVGERLELRGSYDGGARKFLRYGSEDLLTQAAFVDANYLVGRAFALGVDAAAKDRRGGERDYSDLQGAGVVDFFPDPTVDLRLRVGGHRFLYWKNTDYSFGAAEGGLTARVRLGRRHLLSGTGFLGKRRYASDARGRDGLTRVGERREDSVLEGGVGYAYRGRFAFSASYAYAEGSSNSFGESWRRHRLGLTGGLPLFWSLTLLVQLQAHLASYPDGVFLSPELILQQDEENTNSASVKLTRPLSERLDLDLRYALYQNRLRGGADTESLTYLRHVASVGFTFRL